MQSTWGNNIAMRSVAKLRCWTTANGWRALMKRHRKLNGDYTLVCAKGPVCLGWAPSSPDTDSHKQTNPGEFIWRSRVDRQTRARCSRGLGARLELDESAGLGGQLSRGYLAPVMFAFVSSRSCLPYAYCRPWSLTQRVFHAIPPASDEMRCTGAAG